MTKPTFTTPPEPKPEQNPKQDLIQYTLEVRAEFSAYDPDVRRVIAAIEQIDGVDMVVVKKKPRVVTR